MVDFLIKVLEPLKMVRDDNGETKRILLEVHDVHSMLKDFVQKSNRIYAIVNWLQIVHSGLFLCISIYLYTTAAPGQDNSKVMFYGFISMSEPILYCFVSQYLTDKFEELYFSLTEIQWYNFTREEKKIYLIMLHNIQQPVIIRTYWNELSREVFEKVRSIEESLH